MNCCWMLIGVSMLALGCGYHAVHFFNSSFISIVLLGLAEKLTLMVITLGNILYNSLLSCFIIFVLAFAKKRRKNFNIIYHLISNMI